MKQHFQYGVACALEEVPASWPINLRGSIDYLTQMASQLGYDALELQLCNPQNYDWKQLRQTAEQHGLRFCADATGRELIENGLSLISTDAGVRRAAIDRLKLHADMCSELGCLLIEGSMRSSIPDEAHAAQCMDWLCQATEELTAYAAARGVEVVIENITASISNYLNTMREVTDFVRRFSCKNLGVHLDTYSMIAEETDIARAVRYCAPELRYVHFSDTSRFFVGGGNVDFRSHMHALREVGYTGVIAVECRPYPDAYTSAERCIRYMRAMETIVDIERSNFR